MATKNKIIGIPLEGGILCPHFGHCEMFAIVKTENGKITEIKTETPPEHVPGLYPKWISQFCVTDVIAGGMGQKAIDLFNEQNINVYLGAPLQSPQILVTEFLNNNLKLNANYCDRENHNHGNCGH
jgi:predicted Fe-Mo cluster-binding NifX family protein